MFEERLENKIWEKTQINSKHKSKTLREEGAWMFVEKWPERRNGGCGLRTVRPRDVTWLSCAGVYNFLLPALFFFTELT